MRTEKAKKILFFIDGPVPSQADLDAAEALGTRAFRNARHAGGPPKDGCKVAGAVPASYRKASNVTVVQAPTPTTKK